MDGCLFCKIANGEIPCERVFEDEQVLVFRDIQPQAPVHILAIPKRHIDSCAALTEQDSALVGHLFVVLADVAKSVGVAEGFRVVSNTGESAGQSVKHLHFHLLGGRSLSWPPG